MDACSGSSPSPIPLRETARETIEMLRSHGVRRVAMLTGDHAVTARAVAASLALDEDHYGLMPDEKHARILAMRSDGAVLMVGDGVNDAPAMAAADVGVAMGAAASDAALETADVALDVRRAPEAALCAAPGARDRSQHQDESRRLAGAQGHLSRHGDDRIRDALDGGPGGYRRLGHRGRQRAAPAARALEGAPLRFSIREEVRLDVLIDLRLVASCRSS